MAELQTTTSDDMRTASAAQNKKLTELLKVFQEGPISIVTTT